MIERFFKRLFSNTETKPFYVTSEFWAIVGTSINTVLTGPQDNTSLVLSAIAGIYAISRGFAKSGSKPTPPTPPTSVS